MNCPVCFDKSAVELDSAANGVETECRRCGHFKYTGEAWLRLQKEPPAKRALVSGWLWEQNRFGSSPKIDEHNIDSLLSAAPLPFLEKARRLLIHLAERTDALGRALDLASPRLDAMLGTLEHNDVGYVARFLTGQSWLEELAGGSLWRVTGSGLLKADEWKEKVSASSQAFVAMWFDPGLESVWADGLQKGISAAGYKPLRIDNKEHANKICDEIISEIRRSRFLVADYTGHRGGVYYEAGYAAGRNLPVILTCRKSDIAGLHFDIRQYNCIDWERPDELAERLQVRIEAVIGDGPLKPK
jgi:nucleoside 2-deoxyribosyltransferase